MMASYIRFIQQRYVINGWATDGNDEYFCDDCGYSEESGKHAKDCPRYYPLTEDDEQEKGANE